MDEVYKRNLNDKDRETDLLPPTPRQRISTNTVLPLTLTSTWQNVNFGNYSTLDAPGTTFTDGGRYDFLGLKFIANPNTNTEQLYYIKLYMKLSTKQRPVNIQFRYVVQRPVEQGGDFLFPYPDSDKCATLPTIEKKYTGALAGSLTGVLGLINIGTVSLAEDTNTYNFQHERIDPLPIGAALKAYGARIQMRTAETIANAANRPKLLDCYAFILPQ